MSDSYASGPPAGWEQPSPQASGGSGQGTTGVVKDQAANLSQGAVEVGKHAAGTARDQAASVAAVAAAQGAELLRQAQVQLRDQAGTGQQRLAAELDALSQGFDSMAGQPGLAADLNRQAAGATGKVSRWLTDREPEQVLEDVKSFARRRPGAFLALAAGAGLIAGRLTRGLAAASSDEDTQPPAAALPGPAAPRLGASPQFAGQQSGGIGGSGADSPIGTGLGARAGEAGYQPSPELADDAPWQPVTGQPVTGTPGAGPQIGTT